MQGSKKIEGVRKESTYQKPLFEKTKGLTFPVEIIQKFNGKRYQFCLQCSSCHGCS